MKKQGNPRGVYEKIPDSDVWWIRYHDAEGRLHREKVGKKSLALKRYHLRKAEIYEGRYFPPRYGPSVESLKDVLFENYRLNQQNLDPVETAWKRLKPVFGAMRAEAITTERLNQYMARRAEQGYSNASINLDMSILKRMFRLAARQTPPKVRKMPVFPAQLKPAPPRKGFVVDQQYETLTAQPMESWLRAYLAVAYHFGLRKQELLDLRVRQVDLRERIIRLDPGTTKNDEGRIVPMTAEVYELLEECLKNKGPQDYVLTRGKKRVIDFRGAWRALTTAAGLQGLLVHDLRRSAVRNMVRSGILQRVAMSITGHKTYNVFERYNIVSEDDIREAALKLEKPTDTRTDTGTFRRKRHKAVSARRAIA